MASLTKPLAHSIELADAELTKSSFDHHEVRLDSAEDAADAALQKRVTRKIDLRLLPLLITIYTLTFLDRVNIGNARLWNMEKDLGMKGLDFNICVLGRPH